MDIYVNGSTGSIIEGNFVRDIYTTNPTGTPAGWDIGSPDTKVIANNVTNIHIAGKSGAESHSCVVDSNVCDGSIYNGDSGLGPDNTHIINNHVDIDITSAVGGVNANITGNRVDGGIGIRDDDCVVNNNQVGTDIISYAGAENTNIVGNQVVGNIGVNAVGCIISNNQVTTDIIIYSTGADCKILGNTIVRDILLGADGCIVNNNTARNVDVQAYAGGSPGGSRSVIMMGNDVQAFTGSIDGSSTPFFTVVIGNHVPAGGNMFGHVVGTVHTTGPNYQEAHNIEY